MGDRSKNRSRARQRPKKVRDPSTYKGRPKAHTSRITLALTPESSERMRSLCYTLGFRYGTKPNPSRMIDTLVEIFAESPVLCLMLMNLIKLKGDDHDHDHAEAEPQNDRTIEPKAKPESAKQSDIERE
jgi:hypothetical protein